MMIWILISIYFIYSLYKVTLSLLQLNFVKNALKNKAVILSKEDFKEAGNVSIINEKFEIFNIIYSFVLLIFWSVYGAGKLQTLCDFDNEILSNTIFCTSFLLINLVFSLPLEIYSSFIKDKKLGFSNMTAKLFIIDKIKSFLLTAIFGAGFFALLIVCFIYLGSSWWIWAFILSFSIIILINLIYPTLIAPIFNKMTPLENEELNEAITSLLESCGFKSSGVFTIDASKRDKRLNAYFGGLGSTKRVVLFDTLIEKLSTNEILAVLGHELGHFKHGDLIKNIILMFFILFILFFALGNIPDDIYAAFNMQANAGAMLVFFILYSPILTAIFEPIISAFSRSHEFGADEFGGKNTNVDDMISALKKLGSENKSFPLSNKIYSFIYHSHPSLYERIKHLENI